MKNNSNRPYIGIILLLLFASVHANGQLNHQDLTATAWQALVAADYETAIAKARKCIQDYDAVAKSRQVDLERAGKQLPSGIVTGEARTSILANGPLNDVATCYFIIGEANRQFVWKDAAKFNAAKSAYEETRKLSFGRSVSTNGVFWIPADRAALRLQALSTSTNQVSTIFPGQR